MLKQYGALAKRRLPAIFKRSFESAGGQPRED
jgi:hypothetical protein